MNGLFHKDLPVYSFQDAGELRQWLTGHHTQTTGFWLRYYKKASGMPTVIHDQAVDEALCWGWIDGLINKYDDESYLVRFTPRRAKSVWSKVNVAKVEKLITEGRMQPSGLKLVAAAKADGRWQAAYAGQASIEVPAAFIDLLKTEPQAWAFYQTLNKANLYAVAYRLATAVGEDKKQRKMQQLLAMLKESKTFH